jgi:uncharacterized protein (TIGR02285 family)
MRRFKCISIILILVLLPVFLFAQDRETITWIQNDFPPIWILDGPHKGQGGADLIQSLVIENLPEYDHKTLVTNNSRFKLMVKKKENVCSCATFKTEDREKIMVFNRIPSSFIFSNGIITKKSNRHLFGSALPVSLDRILGDTQLVLGIESDRKFSLKIDDILAVHQKSPRIHRRTAMKGTTGLIDMMLLGRVDFIIGFDWELQYLVRNERSPEQVGQLIFLPIEETLPFLISYIACAKTDWGLGVIQRIDRILRKEIHTPEYRHIWEQWMSDKALYEKLYHRYFLRYVRSNIKQ